MNHWKYTHPHDPLRLSMHDCTVTGIDVEDGEDELRMTWHLPDGIWVTPDIPYHEIKDVCRTAEAELVFTVKHRPYEWDASAAVCMKSRWHGKDKRMLTETWSYMSLDEFMARMQENGWSLEIVNTYTEDSLFLVMGELHSSENCRLDRFRLEFWADSAEYGWNAIRPDRVW